MALPRRLQDLLRAIPSDEIEADAMERHVEEPERNLEDINNEQIEDAVADALLMYMRTPDGARKSEYFGPACKYVRERVERKVPTERYPKEESDINIDYRYGSFGRVKLLALLKPMVTRLRHHLWGQVSPLADESVEGEDALDRAWAWLAPGYLEDRAKKDSQGRLIGGEAFLPDPGPFHIEVLEHPVELDVPSWADPHGHRYSGLPRVAENCRYLMSGLEGIYTRLSQAARPQTPEGWANWMPPTELAAFVLLDRLPALWPMKGRVSFVPRPPEDRAKPEIAARGRPPEKTFPTISITIHDPASATPAQVAAFYKAGLRQIGLPVSQPGRKPSRSTEALALIEFDMRVAEISKKMGKEEPSEITWRPSATTLLAEWRGRATSFGLEPEELNSRQGIQSYKSKRLTDDLSIELLGPGLELARRLEEDLATLRQLSPIQHLLEQQPDHLQNVLFDFKDLEAALGVKLPPEAHARRWWTNRRRSNTMHADTWLSVGWGVANVQLSEDEKRIAFARFPERG